MLCSLLKMVKAYFVISGLLNSSYYVNSKNQTVGVSITYQNHEISILNDKQYVPCFKNSNDLVTLSPNVYKQAGDKYDHYLIFDTETDIYKVRNKYQVHLPPISSPRANPSPVKRLVKVSRVSERVSRSPLRISSNPSSSSSPLNKPSKSDVSSEKSKKVAKKEVPKKDVAKKEVDKKEVDKKDVAKKEVDKKDVAKQIKTTKDTEKIVLPKKLSDALENLSVKNNQNKKEHVYINKQVENNNDDDDNDDEDDDDDDDDNDNNYEYDNENDHKNYYHLNPIYKPASRQVVVKESDDKHVVKPASRQVINNPKALIKLFENNQKKWEDSDEGIEAREFCIKNGAKGHSLTGCLEDMRISKNKKIILKSIKVTKQVEKTNNKANRIVKKAFRLGQKIDNYPSKSCTANGDPHYTNFNGEYIDLQQPGVFIMAKTDDDLFEVQIKQDGYTKPGTPSYIRSAKIKYDGQVYANNFNKDGFMVKTSSSSIIITVPGEYKGAMLGLCGSNNVAASKANYKLPSGQIADVNWGTKNWQKGGFGGPKSKMSIWQLAWKPSPENCMYSKAECV